MARWQMYLFALNCWMKPSGLTHLATDHDLCRPRGEVGVLGHSRHASHITLNFPRRTQTRKSNAQFNTVGLWGTWNISRYRKDAGWLISQWCTHMLGTGNHTKSWRLATQHWARLKSSALFCAIPEEKRAERTINFWLGICLFTLSDRTWILEEPTDRSTDHGWSLSITEWFAYTTVALESVSLESNTVLDLDVRPM